MHLHTTRNPPPTPSSLVCFATLRRNERAEALGHSALRLGRGRGATNLEPSCGTLQRKSTAQHSGRCTALARLQRDESDPHRAIRARGTPAAESSDQRYGGRVAPARAEPVQELKAKQRAPQPSEHTLRGVAPGSGLEHGRSGGERARAARLERLKRALTQEDLAVGVRSAHLSRIWMTDGGVGTMGRQPDRHEGIPR